MPTLLDRARRTLAQPTDAPGYADLAKSARFVVAVAEALPKLHTKETSHVWGGWDRDLDCAIPAELNIRIGNPRGRIAGPMPKCTCGLDKRNATLDVLAKMLEMP